MSKKEIKECPRKKCYIYPDFCPEACSGGSYKTCLLLTKKERRQ